MGLILVEGEALHRAYVQDGAWNSWLTFKNYLRFNLSCDKKVLALLRGDLSRPISKRVGNSPSSIFLIQSDTAGAAYRRYLKREEAAY